MVQFPAFLQLQIVLILIFTFFKKKYWIQVQNKSQVGWDIERSVKKKSNVIFLKETTGTFQFDCRSIVIAKFPPPQKNLFSPPPFLHPTPIPFIFYSLCPAVHNCWNKSCHFSYWGKKQTQTQEFDILNRITKTKWWTGSYWSCFLCPGAWYTVGMAQQWL